MRRKHNFRPTFRTILTQLEVDNSSRLMERARLANRLAKSLEGRSRSKAYRVKHRALRALASSFPNRVCIHHDPRLPEFLVVESLTNRCGLHAPREALELQSLDDRIAA
jgi:hypothetical protein